MKRRHTIALVALCGVAGRSRAYRRGRDRDDATARSGSRRSRRAYRRARHRSVALPADQPLELTVVLQPSHTDELASLIRDLYDPTSPRYEQWLATGEFARRFGPSPSRSKASRVGCTTRVSPHTTRAGNGRARERERASGRCRARRFVLEGPTGRGYDRLRRIGTHRSCPGRSPATSRPSSGSPTRSGSTTRSTRARTRSSHRGTATSHRSTRASTRCRRTPRRVASAPFACPTASAYAGASFWTADQVGRFYHVNDLFSAGLTGKGKTIALLELGRSRAADTNHYLSCFGLHNTVKVKHIDGGAGGQCRTERSKPRSTSRKPRRRHRARRSCRTKRRTRRPARSTRTTRSSPTTARRSCRRVGASAKRSSSPIRAAPAFINALHTLFQQAAAQGQSVFAAGGDTGSEDCYDGTKHSAERDAAGRQPRRRSRSSPPSAAPRSKARASSRCGTTARAEPATRARPAATMPAAAVCRRSSDGRRGSPSRRTSTCTTCREVPDISGERRRRRDLLRSDPRRGFGPDNWTAVGGTSIAAPLMAGITADIAQGCKAGRLGNLAPRLYALAAKHVYGTALTDVTIGINWATTTIETPGDNDLTRTHGGQFRTTTGFDLATGLGVPIASGLACPQVTSITPNHGTTGLDPHAARRRAREGDDQVRFGDGEGAVGRPDERGRGRADRTGRRQRHAARARSAPARGPRRSRIPAPTAARTARPPPTATSSTSAARTRTARPTRRSCARRSSGWRSTTRPAATGSRPPTATSTPSTRRSSATRARTR